MKQQNCLDEDSSEDADYVPTVKELKQAGVEPDVKPVEKELTGIALIKEKRK